MFSFSFFSFGWLVGWRGIMGCNSEAFRCRHMFGFYRGGLYGWCLLRWVFVCGEGRGRGGAGRGRGRGRGRGGGLEVSWTFFLLHFVFVGCIQ